MTIAPEMFPLIDEALERGGGSVLAGELPFLPWVVMEAPGGDRSLAQVQATRVEDAVAHVQEFLSGAGADVVRRWAFAMDGYVPFEGEKWDAIIVRAFNGDTGALAVVAQRYRHNGTPNGVELVGDAFRLQ